MTHGHGHVRLVLFLFFFWHAITGGKFVAPLLLHSSVPYVGQTLSLQYALVALQWDCGGVLGGVLLGTVAFMGHAVPQLVAWQNPVSLWLWQGAMRLAWAVGYASTAAAMEKMCVTTTLWEERPYGALGWALGTSIAGILIDYWGWQILYAMAMIAAIMLAGAFHIQNFQQSTIVSGPTEESILVGHDETTTQEETDTPTRDLFLKIWPTCRGSAFLLFLLTFSMGLAVVDNLSFLYFDSLKSSNTINGFTVVFSVVFELPLFYYATTLLNLYGPTVLLLAAGAALLIRLIGYTLVPVGHMEIIFIVESLHGISSTCSKTASGEFFHRIFPESDHATTQTLLFAIRFVGIVIGLAVAGWTQDSYGPRFLYSGITGIVFVGCMGLLVAGMCNRVPDKQSRAIERMDCVESESLVKSESCCSSGSGLADLSAEKWVRSLKYDSLNKYVKDW